MSSIIINIIPKNASHFGVVINNFKLLSQRGLANTTEKPKDSKRMEEFRKKLRETTPITDLGEQVAPDAEEDPLKPWPENTNPNTGEVGGPRGPEPTRYGDWERKGRCIDF